MAAYTLAGTVLGPSGALNGASVYAYAASLFSGIPDAGTAPPAGTLNSTYFGPVTSGTLYGGNGQWQLGVGSAVAYYIGFQYPIGSSSSEWYWTYDDSLVVGASSGVSSFDTRTGAVTLTKADVTGTGLTYSDVNADVSGAAASAQSTAETFATAAVLVETNRAEAAEALLASIAGPTFTGITTAPEFSASGLTGATAASRYVGATTSAAPASGTFVIGDWIIDRSGKIWVCTTGGSPGTWTEANTAAAFFSATGLTGATAGARFVGSTTSGAPATGTFVTGDFIIDQTGAIWVCTSGGTSGTWQRSYVSGLTQRTASATAVALELTIVTGSTAAQTLTLPTTPPNGTANTVLNYASVSWTLAAGGSDSISMFGTAGSITLLADQTVELVYLTATTTWYAIISNVLPVASGGTGATNAAAAITNLGSLAANAAVLTASATYSATVATNVTGLAVPLLASQNYFVESEIFAANAGTSSTAVGVCLTVPAGATLTYDVYGMTNSTATRQVNIVTTNTIQTGFITTSGFTGFIKIAGVVSMGTTTGSVAVQIDCVSSVSNTATTVSVYNQSFLLVTQI